MLDYDYYRRKVDEMKAKGVKDMSKLTRNADKLRHAEAAFLNTKNELKARADALLAERWDFANAPLLQLLDFQQNL
jgi:hypothetical protein